MEIRETLVNRFYDYVAIPSQSCANGGTKVPSTEGQWDMARAVQKDLERLGLEDIHLSEYGVLTARLPAHLPAGFTKRSLPWAFARTLIRWTSTFRLWSIPIWSKTTTERPRPERRSTDRHDHQGPSGTPALSGDDLIVTDGTSVLGSDNKAAVTNVVTALETLTSDPSLYHGDIYVAFVPDEEVGLFGSKHIDFSRFPVDFAYTIDCCELGEVVYETFNAGSGKVTIHGVSAHPMSAKGVLVNPTLLAVDFINLFDRKETPECTEGKEGYIWCQAVQSNQSTAVVTLNIRDHDKTRYEARKALIRENVERLKKMEPRARVELELVDIYGNIADAVTDENHKAIDYIYDAMKELGITPKTIAMRGRTDGSYISTQKS